MPIAPGDSEEAKRVASFGAGRPPGSRHVRWNNFQDIIEIGYAEWEKLSPIQKVEKAQEHLRIILEKVGAVHLTAEQSLDNALGKDGGAKQHDLAPQVGTANGGSKDKSLGSGTSGLSDAVDSEGSKK